LVSERSLVMTRRTIIAAGHCCLDVIPTFASHADGTLVPGKLIDVGPAVLAPGGCVSNVGLALHHLGTPVRLLGKVGGDQFGRILLDHYAGADLAAGMLISSGETTSYSVVISQPDSDRIFLHCPGANHTFSAAEIADQDLTGAAIFHFGYPPLMRRMYQNEGAEVAQIFQTVQAQGIFTSLDLALPDPASDAGQIDWQVILRRTLPFVDAFLPSIEELLFMLDRERYEQLRHRFGDDRLINGVDGPLVEEFVERLIMWGAAMVAVKMGDRGLLLGTTTDPSRWETLAAIIPNLADPAWHGRRLFAPCYQVDVAGTTGAGDATIAGFLLGLLVGGDPAATVRGATAVGACSVERVDATSGIPPWEQVQRRLRSGWAQRPVQIALPGWTYAEAIDIWHGPSDPGPAGHQ
jgi:sugar/nucleoside kinase (ribokinase family)